jgi:hypothetical protein
VATTAKAAAGFAGARSLYRGVERQQIRLPGDLFDHPDDVGDFASRRLDTRHGVDRLADHLAAPIGGVAHAVGRLVRVLGMLGI